MLVENSAVSSLMPSLVLSDVMSKHAKKTNTNTREPYSNNENVLQFEAINATKYSAATTTSLQPNIYSFSFTLLLYLKNKQHAI